MTAVKTLAELAQQFDVHSNQTLFRKGQLLVEEQDHGPEQAKFLFWSRPGSDASLNSSFPQRIVCYTAPVRFRTAGTVLARITISCQRVQCSTYHVSS